MFSEPLLKSSKFGIVTYHINYETLNLGLIINYEFAFCKEKKAEFSQMTVKGLMSHAEIIGRLLRIVTPENGSRT